MTIQTFSGEIALNYIRRGDLQNVIEHHMGNFYKVLTARVPFEELMATDTYTCGINDPSIDVGTETPDLAGFKSLRINYLDGTGLRLKKDHVNNFDKTGTPPSRRPCKYARYGKSLELWPPPDQEYIITARYWKKGVLSGTIGNTVMLVPDEWLELIAWETTYRVLIFLGRMQDAMSLVIGSPQPRMPSPKTVNMVDMGIIPRLWNELMLTIYEREYDSDDFSINPLVRDGSR